MLEYIILGVVVIIIALSIKTVRPTERGLVERLGKYNRFANPGLNFIIPIIENMVRVDITESMVEIDTQTIITKNLLNSKVDMVIFYKVREDEESIKKSVYKVTNFEPQIIKLSQTTARNVIGCMDFKEVNSERNKLNTELLSILKKETTNWGVDIIRVELKDINPPADVQDSMNQIIKAENEKIAAVNFATAVETQADGKKRAAIKEAEGIGQGKIIVAKAEAEKIKLINDAARKYFTGNAQKLKSYEAMQASLQTNSKIILTEKGISPNLLVGNLMSDGK